MSGGRASEGAGTASGQGTLGGGIVDDGSVDGFYIDSNGVAHGFLRSPSGAIKKFDPPGSVNTILHTPPALHV